MPTARVALAAATGPDGRIYVLGGIGGTTLTLSVVEAYSSITDTWTTLQPMLTTRSEHAAAFGRDGLLYVIGGREHMPQPPDVFLGRVDAYIADSNGWRTVQPLPTSRFCLAAVMGPDGRIYAIGGFSDGMQLGSVDGYVASSNGWHTFQPMPTPRSYLAAATGPDGRIYAIGGLTSGSGLPMSSAVEVFNPDA